MRLGLLLLFVVHLLLTVTQSTKVRNLAHVALVEGAFVVCKHLSLPVIVVAFVSEARIFEDSLLASMNHCENLYNLLQAEKLGELIKNWL